MPAYIIVEIQVHDPKQYERYKELAGPTVTAFGGSFVVRGGSAEVLEGNREPGRIVVLEFPTVQRAKEWWASDAYTRAREIRSACSSAEMIVVDRV